MSQPAPYKINIIKSNASLLSQHNLYTWEVNEKTIVNVNSFSKISDKITSFINDRIKCSSSKDLDLFIECNFHFLLSYVLAWAITVFSHAYIT